MSLDPDAVTRKTFETSFRGYDPMEVQAFLLVVADELRAARDRHFDLELRLSEAERRTRDAQGELRRLDVPPPPPPAPPTLEELGHDDLVRLVGEETARVLAAARTAAEEIVQRAENEAAGTAAQASARAGARIQVAEEESVALLARTRLELDALRREAQADASELRTEAFAEHDEVTTRAQQEATAIRQAADVAAAAVRAASDEHADAQRVAAHADAAALLSEAQKTHDETLEQARTMADEVKAFRRRVLDDLIGRRRELSTQIQQLQAARDHLVVALGGARSTLDDLDELAAGMLDSARTASLEAVDGVDAQPVATVEDLERYLDGRRDRSRLLAEPATADADVAADAVAADTDAAGDTVDADTDAAGDTVDAGIPAAADDADGTVDAAPAGSTDTATAATPPATARSERQAVAATGEGHDRGDPDDGEGVTSLFARIRADADAFIAPMEFPTIALPVRGGDARSSEPAESDAPGGHAGGSTRVDGAAPLAESTPPAEGAEPPVDLVDEPADVALARKRAIAGPERGLGRSLKRALSEEQNQLLDTLRRDTGLPSLVEALGTAPDHGARFAAAARAELRDAAYAGAHLLGEPVEGADRATVEDLAAQIADDIVAPLRERLEACWAEAADNEIELLELVRGTYRQWRNKVLPELTEQYVALAFNRGLTAGAGEAADPWLMQVP